jgi:hypothetical protein
MNLTNQPPYQKDNKPRRSAGKARHANALEKRYWAAVRALGCILGLIGCRGGTTIHHCGTGAGGRKDHMKVIPLCYEHHLGAEGIDGKRMSKRDWQAKYGSEDKLLKRVQRRLESPWRDENNDD